MQNINTNIVNLSEFIESKYNGYDELTEEAIELINRLNEINPELLILTDMQILNLINNVEDIKSAIKNIESSMSDISETLNYEGEVESIDELE